MTPEAFKMIQPTDVPNSCQIRMARAALNLTIRELADLVDVNKATIVRVEAGESVRASTKVAIAQKLVELGASFWENAHQRESFVCISKS